MSAFQPCFIETQANVSWWLAVWSLEVAGVCVCVSGARKNNQCDNKAKKQMAHMQLMSDAGVGYFVIAMPKDTLLLLMFFGPIFAKEWTFRVNLRRLLAYTVCKRSV